MFNLLLGPLIVLTHDVKIEKHIVHSEQYTEYSMRCCLL